MAGKTRIAFLPMLSMAVLAAAAGYIFGQHQTPEQQAPSVKTPEQKVPNMTPPPPPPPTNCGTPSHGGFAGSLLKGVSLEGDGIPLPGASWTLKAGSGAHMLKVINKSNTAIQVDLVQLYDDVDNMFQLSDTLPASCYFPTLTNPGCASLAAFGGSCTFTIQTTNLSLSTYLGISTPVGGLEVSLPIIP